jgi:CRISPR system Cascade subunit CasB
MNPSPSPEQRFIAYLAGLAGKSESGEERKGKQKHLGALAALRRGLGKPSADASEMFPYVVPFIGDHMSLRRQDDYFLVASLFAAHQIIWPHPSEQQHAGERTNLGASFHRLAIAVNSSSIEQRFVALLNAEREDLPDHLRHAISLLKSRDIPVDWLQLLLDLRGWDWDSRSVQRSWALAFWHTAPTVTPSQGQSAPAPAAATVAPTTSMP